MTQASSKIVICWLCFGPRTWSLSLSEPLQWQKSCLRITREINGHASKSYSIIFFIWSYLSTFYHYYWYYYTLLFCFLEKKLKKIMNDKSKLQRKYLVKYSIPWNPLSLSSMQQNTHEYPTKRDTCRSRSLLLIFHLNDREIHNLIRIRVLKEWTSLFESKCHLQISFRFIYIFCYVFSSHLFIYFFNFAMT